MEKHPCEIRYPIQTTTWKELDEKHYKLHLKKNLDYSPANILYMGMPGAIVRLWDKYCRLLNLFGIPLPNFNTVLADGKASLKKRLLEMQINPDNVVTNETINKIIEEEFKKMELESTIKFEKVGEKEAANETIEDTIEDLGNYARILHLVYLGAWGR